MARITYTGIETGLDGTVRWHDRVLKPNEAIETDHPALIAAAKANPHFTVTGADDEPENDRGGGSGDFDPGDAEDLDGFKIVPTGRGWFKILDPEGVEVGSGLRKDKAEARVLELAAAR